MTPPPSEFSRVYDLRHLPGGPVTLSATSDEARRLAGRFGLSAIHAFAATVELVADGAVVRATGRITAQLDQPCAISGEDFPVMIDEAVALVFVPEGAPMAPDSELELSAADCEEIAYTGTSFDLGEALAQSLGLAIDPFAEGPNADAARARWGLDGRSSSAFAALGQVFGDDGTAG